MSVKEQFQTLTMELASLKNRVRSFLQTKNWLTDGEWKESVLRTVLRRHLPTHLEPLRGFVIDGEQFTRQIDILIYDNTKPVLFRDGDLVFVTPDAVVGIIEVKSTINNLARLNAALQPLADNAEIIRKNDNDTVFSGLFAFDTELDASRLKDVLRSLHSSSKGLRSRAVDIVSLGDSLFVLNWDSAGPRHEGAGARRWHAYHLDKLAPGYFINNVVHWTSPASVQRHLKAWFPHVPEEPVSPGERNPKQDAEDIGFGVVEHSPRKVGQ